MGSMAWVKRWIACQLPMDLVHPGLMQANRLCIILDQLLVDVLFLMLLKSVMERFHACPVLDVSWDEYQPDSLQFQIP